jgi:15-cis-phytoene synthase
VSPAVSQSITRKSASNLALAFVLLPRPQREGMVTLYAFCRQVDDIADNESLSVEERRNLLASWREDIQRACTGGVPRLPVNRELEPIIQRCHLSQALFDELLRGVEMDLEIKRYATFTDLEQYCYRVASVVGLLSIEIFGYRNAGCREYAISLGKALQLTNILRDVRVDAERGRIYLPVEEMERCAVREDEVLRFQYSTRFRDLAGRVAERAEGYYRQARETLPREDRRSMIAAELMGAVYWRLLQQLARRQFDVFRPPLTRVGKGPKLLLILRTWFRLRTGAGLPNYGAP